MMSQGAGAWILVLVLVLAGVIALLLLVGLRTPRRETSGQDDGAQHAMPDPAEQILRERFARGEIDEAEYESRQRALGAR